MSNMKKAFAAIFVTTAMAFSVPVLARGGWHHGGGPNCEGPYGGGPYGGGSRWTQEQQQDYQQYRTERIQARLNYMARQLNITSAQQSAWDSYAKAMTNMANQRWDQNYPGPDASQAAVLKYRSDRAAAHSKTLNELSQATAKLEAVLTAEQKQQFNYIDAYGYGHGSRGGSGGPGGPGVGHRGGWR